MLLLITPPRLCVGLLSVIERISSSLAFSFFFTPVDFFANNIYHAPMKPIYMLLLTIALLFSQMSSLDHAYHIHKPGEACDYCLSAHSLDHAIPGTIHFITPVLHQQSQESQVVVNPLTTTPRLYAVRGPPRFI